MSENPADQHTVVLTGGTSGIGRVCAKELAATGATVAVIGRNRTRGESLAADTTNQHGDIRFYQADLASQTTVRSLAEELLDSYERIDVLVHNAGLSARRRIETEDGVELTLAVNHLAPYLLTHELLGRLQDSSPARIVITASAIHNRATLDFNDLQFNTGYNAIRAYARSKLANIAFTLELADRLPNTEVTANCFHPGFVPSTNLFRSSPFWLRIMIRAAGLVPGVGTTEAVGAKRLERLITEPQFGKRTGMYVTDDGITSPSKEATDPVNRERLWEISADLVGVDPGWL